MGGDRREEGMSVEEAEEQMREEGDSSTELLGSSGPMEEQERKDCDDRVEHRAPAPETSLEAEEGQLVPVLGTSDL